MTADHFRRLALAMANVIEGAHMGHPDFRVGGKIFATLHADMAHGMVKLTPEDQARFVREMPGSFAPENGAWGRQGCTRVTLASVDEESLGEALTLAFQAVSRAAAAARVKARARRKSR
jgi:YjbR